MGFSHQDAALLSNSFDSLSRDLLANRAMNRQEENEKRLEHYNQLMAQIAAQRQQSLDEYHKGRIDVEQQKVDQTAAAKGPKLTVFLQDPDNPNSGTMQYSGTPDELEKIQAQREQQGKSRFASVPDPKTPGKPLVTVTSDTAQGRIQQHFYSPEEFDQWKQTAPAISQQKHVPGENLTANELRIYADALPDTDPDKAALQQRIKVLAVNQSGARPNNILPAPGNLTPPDVAAPSAATAPTPVPAVQPTATPAPTPQPFQTAPAPAASAKPLTEDIARQFLNLSGGDKVKARLAAQQAGYTW